MKCSEIFEYLNKLYPLELAMDWDNSGFLLGRSDKEVRNVLVVLDITNEVLEYTQAKDIDLIVSHHPIIFSALKRVTDETLLGNYILNILKNDISVIAMHTNFDIAKGGMADIAEQKLSLSNTKPLEVTATQDGKDLGIGKIGDLKKANNELQSDIENKNLIDQKRQEFVANVSHELKTPIALIMGYAEGLGEGLCEDEESRAYYSSVIVDEAKRMNHMVKELMSLSAMEQGKDLPDFSLLDMAKLTKGVLSTMEILLKQEGISVEVDIPEGLFLWGDEFKVEEVLMNYLQNAIHHVGEPKQISVYTENRGQKTVEIHVRNTGNPIPEEDLPRVFEKFYKVDKAHSRSYGGSGLGLSIVKAIMDSHHQECGCKNTLTGVDFWFTLEKGETTKT